jgi:hypothetical protein
LQNEDWWQNTSQIVKSWTGYDGSPNVENVTKGHVKHFDLTQNMTLGRNFHWVMSMEVGEHIPQKFESIYLSNVAKHVQDGLVLSWAVRGQGGRMHVNNMNNDEVEAKLGHLGFRPVKYLWEYLRSKATKYWFKNTLMVFKPEQNVMP